MPGFMERVLAIDAVECNAANRPMDCFILRSTNGNPRSSVSDANALALADQRHEDVAAWEKWGYQHGVICGTEWRKVFLARFDPETATPNDAE